MGLVLSLNNCMAVCLANHFGAYVQRIYTCQVPPTIVLPTSLSTSYSLRIQAEPEPTGATHIDPCPWRCMGKLHG